MCFLCAEEIDAAKSDKSIRRSSTLILRNTLLSQCDVRCDEWALTVKGLLESCNDLPSEEAVYHCNCYMRFVRNRDCKPAGHHGGRPVDTVKADAFEQLCDWLDTVCETRCIASMNWFIR